MTDDEYDRLLNAEHALYAPDILHTGFRYQVRNYDVSDFLDLRNLNIPSPLLEQPPKIYSSLNHPHDLLESIRKNDNSAYISEALLKSWEINKAVKLYLSFLYKKIPKRLLAIECAGEIIVNDIDMHDDKFIGHIPLTNKQDHVKFFKELAKSMFVAGYFLAYITQRREIPKTKLMGINIYAVCFEKKFSKEVIKLSNTLYHVSPVRYFKKIQKHGLVPATKAANFKYPERVYLFNKGSVQDVAYYGYLRHLHDKPCKEKDFFASLDNVYVVYAIDKKQLLNHSLYKSGKIVFYVDPQYDGHVGGVEVCQAIFTYGAIPRELIKDECYVYDVDSKTPGSRLKRLRTANFR